MPVKAGVIRAGARTTRRGAAETFTGVVFQDPVITAEAPSRLGGSVVTFTPGARTAWHSHPVGQTLFCLSGVGRICFKGEKPQVLNPGDTVNIPPDTMHWHGAAPDRLFSHLALSEAGEQGQGAAWGRMSATLSTTRRRAGAEYAERLKNFSWFGRNRRLAKDFENLTETLPSFVTLASIQLALRRLARE
jgi:quercetin dioxygenase-like cupin family protein